MAIRNHDIESAGALLVQSSSIDPGLLAGVPLDTVRTLRNGMLILVLGFGGFMLWSSLAELSSGAVAPGIIAVSSNRKTIDHLEGGIVREVLVKEGDMVETGDVLVRLDDVEAKAQVEILTALYGAAVAEGSRLRAERDGEAISTEDNALLGSRSDTSPDTAMSSQRSIFEARTRVRDTRVAVLQSRIAQLNQQQEAYSAQLAGEEKMIELVNTELATLRTAFKNGYITRTQLFSRETEATRTLAERDALKAMQTKTREEVAETEAQILQITADFQDDVTSKLSEAEDKIADLRERLTAARQRLERIVILSPVSGEIVSLQVHTLGASIRPSEPIMEIVPREDRRLIEAQLSPADIERVSVGQPAEVRFVTLPRTMPTLRGVVQVVSADRMVDAERNYSYFLLRVGVDDDELDKLGETRIQAGMPVEVMVKTGERTMLRYLMDPLVNSLGRTFKEE